MTEVSPSTLFRDPLGPRSTAPELLAVDVPEAAYRTFCSGGMAFALPDSAVLEWQTLEGEEVGRTIRGPGARRLQLDDRVVPLRPLEDLLPEWLEAPCAPPVADHVEVLVLGDGDERVAVSVEQVEDLVDIDFQPREGAQDGPVLGAKVVADVGVVFILDVATLLRLGAAG